MSLDIEIKELSKTDTLPYDLLLLADPSKNNINKYIFESTVCIATLNEKKVGCYALYRIDDLTTEIKNVAVDEKFQGKGIGSLLVDHAVARSKANGSTKVIIGTGNSSTGQLYLYQKLGFQVTEVKRNFFIENYADPIFENGIHCTDMIVLTKHL